MFLHDFSCDLSHEILTETREKLCVFYTIYCVIHMKNLMVKPEKIVWKYTISRVNERKLVCPFSHEKLGKNTRFFV